MIRLAAQQEKWVLGFVDETWWSRLVHPQVYSWTEGASLRLLEREKPQGEGDPQALCCYGLLRTDTKQIWLRFVDGRPVSHVTIAFLEWGVKRLAAEGKKVWVVVWDNASWHKSQRVRTWLRQHNQKVKREGGVRIVPCRLPVKSPWLNPIEPHWVHGKRAIVEPTRTLTPTEVISRVCDYFGCEQVEHLKQKVA